MKFGGIRSGLVKSYSPKGSGEVGLAFTRAMLSSCACACAKGKGVFQHKEKPTLKKKVLCGKEDGAYR